MRAQLLRRENTTEARASKDPACSKLTLLSDYLFGQLFDDTMVTPHEADVRRHAHRGLRIISLVVLCLTLLAS